MNVDMAQAQTQTTILVEVEPRPLQIGLTMDILLINARVAIALAQVDGLDVLEQHVAEEEPVETTVHGNIQPVQLLKLISV